MIGILSDAHGNISAFTKAISVLRNQGADEFLFLGDAIGYIPSGDVLSTLYEMSRSDVITCIMGNHEEMALFHEFDLKRDAVYKLSLVMKDMSADVESFVRTWPRFIEKKYPCGSALFVHGSPKDPTNDYIYPDSDLAPLCSGLTHKYVFSGHTHRPFIKEEQGHVFVNVGSCGLPRDCGNVGSAALFDEMSGNVRIVRFSIQDSIDEIVNGDIAIHDHVKKLFDRTGALIIGDYIDD